MTETQPGAAGEDQQPTLREDAMYAMGYQRGVKAGWNLCIEDDQEGFARTQASTEHVRVLLDSRCAPPAAAPAVQTELTEHRINELAWETFKSDPRTLFATRCQEFARSIEREARSLLSGTRTCVQAPSDGGQQG